MEVEEGVGWGGGGGGGGDGGGGGGGGGGEKTCLDKEVMASQNKPASPAQLIGYFFLSV